VDARLAEDVGVARDHLVVDAAGERREVEVAALPAELGEKDDLEEKVAELPFKLAEILALERVQGLVALLEEVARQGLERLFPVPGALLPEPFHEADEGRCGVAGVSDWKIFLHRR
jgi:hypothetical protein